MSGKPPMQGGGIMPQGSPPSFGGNIWQSPQMQHLQANPGIQRLEQGMQQMPLMQNPIFKMIFGGLGGMPPTPPTPGVTAPHTPGVMMQ